jgi:hypothetical protein
VPACIDTSRAEQHGKKRHYQRNGESGVAPPGHMPRGDCCQRIDAGCDRLVLQSNIRNCRRECDHCHQHCKGSTLAESRCNKIRNRTDLMGASDLRKTFHERQCE